MQILALGPGISRSGVAMAAGMRAGIRREDAVRFSFLLATPVIFAAGVLKLPDLFGPLGDGIRPQVVFGSVAGRAGRLRVGPLADPMGAHELAASLRLLLRGGRRGCLVLFALR